jgi:hypothetical protein
MNTYWNVTPCGSCKNRHSGRKYVLRLLHESVSDLAGGVFARKSSFPYENLTTAYLRVISGVFAAVNNIPKYSET